MSRPRRFAWLLALAMAALFCASGTVRAAKHPPAEALRQKSPISLSATPLLGKSTPVSSGWFSISVRLVNTSAARVDGFIELESGLGYGRGPRAVTREPFALPGKNPNERPTEFSIVLPTHSFEHTVPDVKVRALNGDGEQIAEVEINDLVNPGPFLFDIASETKSLESVVRGKNVPIHYQPSGRSSYGSPPLSVSTAGKSTRSGDRILPVRAAGYAPVTVVLASTESLAKVDGAQLEALTSWVLAGGTLAVAPGAPDYLRHGTLTALVGAIPTVSDPPRALLGRSNFLVVPDQDTELDDAQLEKRAPSRETADALSSYSGGNLTPSPWGASATYGLGEVHLLAFDPIKLHVDDPWAQAKVVDLVRHAWERKAHVVLPHAAVAVNQDDAKEIRRLLDPNEGARWAIVLSALILLFYAVLAGPVNFYLASKKNRPLRALWHLPIWAGGTMLLIVLLGVLAKGVTGSARHLSLIESGAGMNQASITRFRAFYDSWSDDLTVHAAASGHVLDATAELDATQRHIVADRDGIRLAKFRAKPWQTAVVREDGFTAMGDGISIVEQGSDVIVKNRMARDLVAVVIKLPKQDARFFERIADGAAVKVADGKALDSTIGSSYFRGRMHELDVNLFRDDIDEVAPKLSDALRAVDSYVYSGIDWWPEDAPVLIGQVDGGEGKTRDSGLGLDSDQVIVRVVGWGGLP